MINIKGFLNGFRHTQSCCLHWWCLMTDEYDNISGLTPEENLELNRDIFYEEINLNDDK